MNKNLFNSIQLTKPKSNVFDLSHDVKLSLNMGELVPIMCLEAIPGDKFNISCESLLRFQPLVSPVMHRMDVTMHYFFVPNRILWPNWDKFITNTKVGGVLPAIPTIRIGTDAPAHYTKLCDYLGLPNPIGTEIEVVSPFPFAAYQRIYNEYYRDQNLIPDLMNPDTITLLDGDNDSLHADLMALRLRAWEHDYFTAALPFAQKGDPVTLPLSFQDVYVGINSDLPIGPKWGSEANWDDTGGGVQVKPQAIDGPDHLMDANAMFAQTSELQGSTTINDLRRATKLQEWLEKAARGGSRYVENILIFFGVKSPDSRLQRPEYITGTKSPVVISEVLNTTGDTGAADPLPQGNMAGHAISVTSGQYGNYFVQEHGYILGIMSVMPKTAYQQGISRHWLKRAVEDYYWPPFANIGEQEVTNRELFAFNGTAGDDTFGYVPRYAEYKYEPNRVAGDMRTNLDFWHLGRIFATPPALNQTFVECVPDMRIFAVIDPDVQHLIAHVYNKVRAVRAMPKFGTPTF